MLRPYKLPKSRIFKVQSFVYHIVLDVLCKPHTAPTFSSSLAHTKYKPLIDGVNNDYIFNPISEAYNICKKINKWELRILRKAVHQNNRIREICNGRIKPVSYDEIRFNSLSLNENKKLLDCIKSFCNNLYDHCLEIKVFYTKYGEVKEYYNQLVGRSNICRFCGLNPVLTKFHGKRSAFDHFFPKGIYPFVSINFLNLVPICDICNSKYKLQTTPTVIKEKQGKIEKIKHTKAFFPFRSNPAPINFEFKLKVAFNDNIRPKDIELNVVCINNEEEKDTWLRLFGIKENYLAECCSDEMRVYIEEEYFTIVNQRMSHNEYVKMLENNKWGNKNFLKIRLLNALYAQRSQYTK